MRLWSLHPAYLDSRGLVALWREALLAQKVLQGGTRGYVRHPQLHRFVARADSAVAIGSYLSAVADEADRRGYVFNRSKILVQDDEMRLGVTTGQVAFEWEHLMRKLAQRDPGLAAGFRDTRVPELHPLFYPVEGPREDWERG